MAANKAIVVRLSRYKNALYRLKSLKFVKVFSDNLADEVGATPSQVRKDFSIFGISGSKRGGYNIDELIESLSQILGKDTVQPVVIVGCGNIGSALMKYPGFEKENISIAACFDIDERKVDRAARSPVLPLGECRNFIRKHAIRIGVIAVPEAAAQKVLDMMIGAGIKGVLNFAPMRLRASNDIVINNVNLISELENVIYFVRTMGKARRS